VSAFEPQLPTDPKVDMPDFMVVLRGFDRRQVEMWAAEVAQQIEQERQRADDAEKRAYRVQIENKGAPSFSHLGTHVASILEEAGRSSENMLADAAERAQETVDAAEEEAAEIIKAAEHRAGEIEGEARRTLEDSRAEGARVEEEALQAAEEMRAQAEQDARMVLEEARDATDMIWQEAERERIGVEAETIRLETLRHRSLEQLGRVYGHLESVLDEVRAGIGRVEEEQEDLDEATAAAAARLGVEPPASSPEESPRFPSPRDIEQRERDREDGMLSATRPETPTPLEEPDPVATDELPRQPALTDTPGEGLDRPSSGDAETLPALDTGPAATTQPTPAATGEATQPTPAATGEATQPTPAATGEATQPTPAATDGPGEAPGNGEGGADDQDATQRLAPVANGGNNKPHSPKPVAKEGKGRH
jgi:cell division septum initiation protein DivIVA